MSIRKTLNNYFINLYTKKVFNIIYFLSENLTKKLTDDGKLRSSIIFMKKRGKGRMENIFESFKERLILEGYEDEVIESLMGIVKETIQVKKYGLIWEEKTENIKERLKQEIPFLKEVKSLEIKQSGNESAQHLLIEGDNFEALKLLETTKKTFVDWIIIDPPYNTGNEFIYNDKIVDKEDRYRHTKWLSFMKKRLNLAKKLLKKTGAILIHIDDNEQAQLKLLCDTVFGEENFITKFIWVNNERGRSTDKFISNTYEEILMYAKDINQFEVAQELEVDVKKLKKYNMRDEISYYKKGDALYNNNSKFNIETRPNLTYSIYMHKETKEYQCIDEKVEVDGKLTLPEENFLGEDYIKIIPPIRSTNGKRGCWRWKIDTFNAEASQELMFSYNTKNVPMLYSKNRLDADNKKWNKYKNCILNMPGVNGTTELTKLMNGKVFDHPKPVALITHLLRMCPNKNAVILDFFAGSGTTGHAVLALNREDGGNRQFILCTNNEVSMEKEMEFFNLKKDELKAFRQTEDYKEYLNKEEYQALGICKSVTYPRLSKVINGYINQKGEEVEGISANLKYYTIERIVKTDKTTEELSYSYMPHVLPLLQLKHQAYHELVDNKHCFIYEGNGVRIAVIDDLVRETDFDVINQYLELYDGEKVLYVFSINSSSCPNYKNLESLKEFIKPIPREILDMLKGE